MREGSRRGGNCSLWKSLFGFYTFFSVAASGKPVDEPKPFSFYEKQSEIDFSIPEVLHAYSSSLGVTDTVALNYLREVACREAKKALPGLVQLESSVNLRVRSNQGEEKFLKIPLDGVYECDNRKISTSTSPRPGGSREL